jgi:hypothetical protein
MPKPKALRRRRSPTGRHDGSAWSRLLRYDGAGRLGLYGLEKALPIGKDAWRRLTVRGRQTRDPGFRHGLNLVVPCARVGVHVALRLVGRTIPEPMTLRRTNDIIVGQRR